MTVDEVMSIEGTAIEVFERPRFLVSYDLEVPDRMYGWGTVVLTSDPREAMTFPDAGAVMAAWKQRSTTMPTRPRDGKPNRPLTRYTISPVRLSEAMDPGVRPWR